MRHESGRAIARLSHTMQLLETEIQRLEMLAPNLDHVAHTKAMSTIAALRADAEVIRGQIQVLETQ
jgi:hypothetical protein